jgi:hypothetical protein
MAYISFLGVARLPIESSVGDALFKTIMFDMHVTSCFAKDIYRLGLRNLAKLSQALVTSLVHSPNISHDFADLRNFQSELGKWITEISSAERQMQWKRSTSTPFYPFDTNECLSSKTVRCPKCQKDFVASSNVFLVQPAGN